MPNTPPTPPSEQDHDFDPESFNPEALDPSMGHETGSLPQAPLFSFGAKLFALLLFAAFFIFGEALHRGAGPASGASNFDTQLFVLYLVALVVILWADGVFDRR